MFLALSFIYEALKTRLCLKGTSWVNCPQGVFSRFDQPQSLPLHCARATERERERQTYIYIYYTQIIERIINDT